MIRWAVRHSFYAAALLTGGAIAWAVARPSVEGSGVSATEERDIGAVTHVSLSGTGDVVIVQGPVALVSVTADDNILPLLATETKGDKLTFRTHGSIKPKAKIVYKVTVPRLEAVTVSGAGTVTAEKLTGDELKVKLSGAGALTLRDATYKSLALDLSGAGKATASGTAERVALKLSGAGKVDLLGLHAKSADVKISGAGQASVWAETELTANLSGAGSVKYKGSPRVEQKVSGAGRVQPAE